MHTFLRSFVQNADCKQEKKLSAILNFFVRK